jgi:serine/threonine protein kinase
VDEGPLAVPRAARLFAEVAAGLDHAHGQGLVHRDLKPSNVLVTPHDHAKVLDLGLALIQGEKDGSRDVVGGQGYVVGTMDYIAPEQTADATKVDARSDIYSLGCTLYFALSGRPPFPGGTSIEKIQRHRREEPTPLLELRPALPGGFAELVARMMAKDPARRPPSAAAVREELRGWYTDDTVLPLDRPEDPAYREAVEALQTVEPSTDYSLTDIAIPTVVPVQAAEEAPAPRPGPVRRTRPGPVRKRRRGRGAGLPAWAWVGLGGLLATAVLLAAWLALWLGRR